MGTYGPKATSAPTGAIILHPGDNISALVSASPTGATFYFEPGVYRGVSLAPKDGQAFIGAEGAILNGSAVLSNWTQSGNLWVIGGQTQQGRVHPGAEFEPGTQRPGYPETVFLDNTPLKPVDALSKVVPGTFYFDYAADKIYIADNPTGHTIEAGKLTDAFHGSATNVTVQNLVIEKYDPQIQDGAIQGGRGWTIQDNEVRLNYAVGIIGVDGSKLIGNYVHDNGQMGLGGFGDNILVQGNEIAKNGYWSGIDVLWEGGGFKFADTDNLVVRGNYSHDNNGIGMWTDGDNIHTLYEDNVVVHNGMGGISHEISYQAIIRNNTLIGNGADDPRSWWWGNEIQIQNSQNVEVYGNRVEMTGGGNGIVMIQQNRGSGTFGTYTTTGNQIHDNIIVDHDGEGYIGGVADYNQSGMLSGGNIWSNNQYFMPDGGDRFEWGGSKTFTQFKGAAHETGSISQSYPDTSGWLTASPADATPSALNSDGLIGPPTTVIEANGSTRLTEVGDHFFLYDGSGSGPSLKYAGADYVAGQFGAWTPIGAEQTATGYEVAWKVTGADQYTVWSTDSSGNYITDLVGAVSGTSDALESFEPVFHQDLNSDGLIGPPTTVIEANGSTRLTEVGDHFFLYDGSGSGPSLKYAGADYVAGQFGAWTPIGAEQTATGYEVAWKVTGADQYTVWSTDSSGNYITNLVGAVSGTSDALKSFEPVFHQDLNSDGLVGLATVSDFIV